MITEKIIILDIRTLFSFFTHPIENHLISDGSGALLILNTLSLKMNFFK